MPGQLTEITELATALGVLPAGLDRLVERPTPPPEFANVDGDTWDRLVGLWRAGNHRGDFLAGAGNGAAFAAALDGLRGRPARRVEWKGPHRTPGDDTVPADLRVDHVYLVSCKYLSRVLSNPGPPRLFENLMAGEGRSGVHWFTECAPDEFQAFYAAAAQHAGLVGSLPAMATDLSRDQQHELKVAFPDRVLPAPLADPWAALCRTVSEESAQRWRQAMPTQRHRLRMLWRLLRIASVTYFVLGTQPSRGNVPPATLRLRVDAAWDWSQRFDLRDLAVTARSAGQPEVAWTAAIHDREHDLDRIVEGHVEVRWSHGRFKGSPEAKVYLDTPHTEVPGYHPLV